MNQIIILTLIDFVLTAALLVAIFKIPSLRYRAKAGLDIAMSYLGSYFRSPETSYRERLIVAAIASGKGASEAERIADEVLAGGYEEVDGEPDYEDEDSEETENFN